MTFNKRIPNENSSLTPSSVKNVFCHGYYVTNNWNQTVIPCKCCAQNVTFIKNAFKKENSSFFLNLHRYGQKSPNADYTLIINLNNHLYNSRYSDLFCIANQKKFELRVKIKYTISGKLKLK